MKNFKTPGFGILIRQLRENRALPLRTVAAYLDIDQAILSKMERGQRKASRDQVLKLAKYFKINVDELLIAWLSDKVIYEIENEDLALKALRVAEEKFSYKNKEQIATSSQGILTLIQRGESSTIQFKERMNDAYKAGTEFVAFTNTKGGTLIIGINDSTGDLNGLSLQEIQDTNQLLANAASDNVKAPIYISTETVTVNGHNIIIAQIPEGSSKPHMDNKGIIWVKNGSDKRKVTAKEEIARLLQSSGNIYADEALISGSTTDHLDKASFIEYYEKNWEESIEETGIPLEETLTNSGVLKDNQLTLGGLLFFGKNPQRFRPAFCIKAVSYVGNDIEGTEYRDSEDIKGTIPKMFNNGMGFLMRNLKKTQQGQNFNSLGILEVSKTALEELLQNALIHRDYLINDSVKLFVFDNRIEIISPGRLPNSLTVDSLRFGGRSVIRNNMLINFCSKTMKYRGIGSGIKRALKEQPDLKLQNDIEREAFIATIPRTQE